MVHSVGLVQHQVGDVLELVSSTGTLATDFGDAVITGIASKSIANIASFVNTIRSR